MVKISGRVWASSFNQIQMYQDVKGYRGSTVTPMSITRQSITSILAGIGIVTGMAKDVQMMVKDRDLVQIMIGILAPGVMVVVEKV